jgi:calcium-dependent protein kinase
MKTIACKHASKNLLSMVQKEINILKNLDHPNIIKVYEFFKTDKYIYIINELCTGGELFDKIVEVKFFSEVVACNIMRQLLSAVAYCHEKGVIHRDLKPENILIESSEEKDKDFFHIKIIDFGTS